MKYVVGFLFSPAYQNIVLIKKKRPEWQNGYLNGVGGKIKKYERSKRAMQREFQEETGVDINEWEEFAVLNGSDYIVHFFKANSFYYLNVKPTTDEKIGIYSVSEIGKLKVIPNLSWLIPMSIEAKCCYNIIEVY